MNIGLVANRYARALLVFAHQQNALERVHADVLRLQKALQEELAHSGNDGILATCIPQLGPEVQQFLRVVAMNGRADNLPAMLRQFLIHYNQEKGIATASLVSAAPLPSLEKKLLVLLHDKGYTDVDFTTSIDPSLIGGFILQIEDQRLDASLASQLKLLKKELEDRNRRII